MTGSKNNNIEQDETIIENQKEYVKPNINRIDLDYVLTNELGQFGLFQLRTVLLLSVVIIISSTIHEYIFSAASTPHRCRIPECGEVSKLHNFKPKWISNAVPEAGPGPAFASCKRYAPLNLGNNGSLDYCSDTLFNTSETIDCDGFVYDKDNTVVYEFDLGCQEWLRALAGTLFNIGMLLTLPITGYISDRFGRKLALVINIFNLGLFGLMRAFSVNYTMYLTLQIVQSTLGTGAFSTAYIMATELVGPKYRVVAGITCSIMFALGEILLGGVAWLITPWRRMIMAITIPYFFLISYYWLISDSVRWLLSKKKYTEAKKILLTAARVNKTLISEKSLEALLNPPQLLPVCNNKSTALVRTVMRSPVLLRRVCTTPVWWITMTFVYYGLSINSTSLSNTMYLNYILTAVIEIPAYLVAVFILDILGRRAIISSGFFFSAICNIVFVFVPSDYFILRLVIYLLGKFGISMVVTSLYLFTSELYPTECRHTLISFSSMIGRIGSIIAPLTPVLMIYWHGIPSLLFGGLGIISGLLVLTQPETLGCKMPDTLAQAEAIGTPESKIVL